MVTALVVYVIAGVIIAFYIVTYVMSKTILQGYQVGFR